MENQTQNQKKISLAQSEHASTVIELIKDCMTKVPLVDEKSEWQTIVNTITLDAQSNLLRAMVDYIEHIKRGGLIGEK